MDQICGTLGQAMKPTLILIILFSLQQSPASSQRTRKYQPTIEQHTSVRPDEPGRYFTVNLSNTDSTVALLKLGPLPKIKNNDTLTLSKNGYCNSPEKIFYYDLHDPKEWITSCISWYTLQPVYPGDTIRFVVRLNNFDSSGYNRLFCCYTREILPFDQHCNMYRSRDTIILQRPEGRKFEAIFLELNKNRFTENLFFNLKSAIARDERQKQGPEPGLTDR